VGKVRYVILPILVTLSLAGCASTPPIDVWCDTHKQVDFQPSTKEIDVMTPDRKVAVLSTLKEGEKRCGWQRPR
jgi:hypothetical protein